MSESWIIDDFAAALDQFEAAMQVAPTSDLIKAGCIEYFEFTFELAWKSVRILAEQTGLEPGGIAEVLPQNSLCPSWIDDEPLWLSMLEARNRMSHTYHAKDALQVYDRLSHFPRPMRALLTALRAA